MVTVGQPVSPALCVWGVHFQMMGMGEGAGAGSWLSIVMGPLPPPTLGLPLTAHYSLPLITRLSTSLHLEMQESLPD